MSVTWRGGSCDLARSYSSRVPTEMDPGKQDAMTTSETQGLFYN